MLNVFITVDTEVWLNGWDDLDRKFPEYFRKYVYGPTAKGDYALPGTLAILEEFGIPAVFFVEPLFSARFGLEPLSEIVGLLREKNQEIQLHLHTEWVDEAGDRILPGITRKLRNLTHCTREQQRHLVQWGLQRLAAAGVERINAFRAGSFCADRNTLHALADNNLTFDTSYNLAGPNGTADMALGETLSQPFFMDNIYEYPVSTIRDPLIRTYRPAQINALSYGEFVRTLNRALEAGWNSLVMVTHNFELLSPDKSRVDRYALGRFRRICEYLSKHRDRFHVRGFQGLEPQTLHPQPAVFQGEPLAAGVRHLQQGIRKFIYR